MRSGLFLLITSNLFGASPAALVDLHSIDYSIGVEMRYAHPSNHLKRKLFDDNRCVLRRPVAMALARAQAQLRLRGYSLTLWDCYRPIQLENLRARWDEENAMPEVATGTVIEATLTSLGEEKWVDMPRPYPEDYLRARDSEARRITPRIRQANRRILRDALKEAGFRSDARRWWRFSFPGEGAIEDIAFSQIPRP